jgi:hypothetical protein
MYTFIIIIIIIFSLYYLFIKNNNDTIILNDFILLSNYPELKILTDNSSVILEELNFIIKNGLWSNYDDLHGKDVFRNNNLDYVLSEMTKSESKVEENTKNPKWKMFGILFNKQSINLNWDYCPKTVSLLKSIPYIINAGFSCLEPNKSTDEHSDNNEFFYRYQLPLIVPEGNTGFKVNTSVIKYKINEPFIFDDCMTHMAWNYTNKIRVVLICDIDKKLYINNV